MPYIYKYTNDSNEVKYVGIIKSHANFPGRFRQHTYDEWYSSSKKWTIQYSFYASQTDVEALEAHLIAVYTKNGAELFNKAKASWGPSAFINEESIEWKEFDWDGYLSNWKLQSSSKPVNERTIDDYIELATYYKLARRMFDLFRHKAENMRLIKTKESDYLVKLANKISDSEGVLHLEDRMLDDVDPHWNDRCNSLLDVFYHGFDKNSSNEMDPAISIEADKATEILYQELSDINTYKTTRELVHVYGRKEK